MTTRSFGMMKAGYANLWASMSIKPGRDSATADRAADTIIKNEAAYRRVETATGVPWFWVGAIHYREASNNFLGVLHNGERIVGTGRKTSLVPAGRGPFLTWSESAIDALRMHGLDKIKDWSIARMGYEAERYNGWGYAAHGVNSPYVWAGTNHEQTGAYVRDHVFDPSIDDPRVGVMAVVKRLAEKRSDVAKRLLGVPTVTAPPKVDVVKSTGGASAAAAATAAAHTGGLPWWAIILITVAAFAAGYFVLHKVFKKD